MIHRVAWGHEFAVLAERFAGAPAIRGSDTACTFQEMLGRAAAVARRLAELGIAHGDPVATSLRNDFPAVWSSYGITLSGAAETALNPRLSEAELAYCLRLAQAKHVITDAATAPLIRSLGFAVSVADEIAAECAEVDRSQTVPGAAWGKILFTSGTTGAPKAIVHSHARRWLANLLLRAHLPIQPDTSSNILLMTPFSHGASLLTYAFLDCGASIQLMDGVQTDEVEALLRDQRVTCMFAPPTVLAKLVAAFEGRRFDGLRVIFSGTSTLSPELYNRVRMIFGPIVRITYGKTEVFNPITVLAPAACDAAYSAAMDAPGIPLGWPSSGVEIAIRDDEGRPCPADMPGEIHVRAAHMMIGHIDTDGFRPFAAGEWHATGDVGCFSTNGALHLVGRRHDVVKSGGYKIYPQEIEIALAEAVGPGTVAVVGVPSAYWGEFLVAVAERAPSRWEEHAAAAAARLTSYKRPRAYVSLSTLPRGAQDKLSRTKILEILLSQYRVADGPHPKLVPK